jgi:hypothetical protein
MEKPQVKIVEFQQEETKDTYVPDYEKNNLLAKYGYKVEDFIQNQPNNPNSNLTFEEMIALEEAKLKEQTQINMHKRNTPRPYSFDQVNYSESKYSSIDLDGTNLGFEVRIMSDMPINQRRY